MDKLNYTFQNGQVVNQDHMNGIVGKINEIITNEDAKASVSGTQFTLEQNSNPAFNRINVGAADRYCGTMGGYMLYKHTDGVVYGAKLNGDWSGFLDGTKLTSAAEAKLETMIKCPPCYAKGEGKTLKFGGNTPIDGGFMFEQAPWVGAYEMYVDGEGKGHSRPGVAPTHSRTMSQFQSYAQNTFGAQGGQAGYRFFCFINALYQAKYGNLDSQSVVGTGGQTGSWEAWRDVPMGSTKALGDGSGNMPTSMSGQNAVKLFGFEDLWGKLWEFRPGIRFYMDGSTRKAVVYGDHLCSNTAAGREFETLASASGQYVTGMQLGEHWDMIAKSVGGGSNTYYCDGYWASTGGELLIVGAYANYGARCGVSYARSDLGFGSSHAYLGSRLAFYGEPKIVSGSELMSIVGAA